MFRSTLNQCGNCLYLCHKDCKQFKDHVELCGNNPLAVIRMPATIYRNSTIGLQPGLLPWLTISILSPFSSPYRPAQLVQRVHQPDQLKYMNHVDLR